MYRYDVTNDQMAWRKLCREYLIGEVAGGALARAHSQSERHPMVRMSVSIERAVKCGFTNNEWCLIQDHWRHAFAPLTPAELVRLGIDDRVAYDTGAFVSMADRELYARDPTQDEVTAALGLWFGYWATLPEPVMSLDGAD